MRFRVTPAGFVRRGICWLLRSMTGSRASGCCMRRRERAIGLLRLQPGAAVLDVACGTGRNFGLILQAAHPPGRLAGLDFTARMLHRARVRAERMGGATHGCCRATHRYG